MAVVGKFLGLNPLVDGDSLAQKLVNHRTALGVTQKRFATQIGVDPGTLARWERKEREPNDKQLQMLAKIGFATSSLVADHSDAQGCCGNSLDQ